MRFPEDVIGVRLGVEKVLDLPQVLDLLQPALGARRVLGRIDEEDTFFGLNGANAAGTVHRVDVNVWTDLFHVGTLRVLPVADGQYTDEQMNRL